MKEKREKEKKRKRMGKEKMRTGETAHLKDGISSWEKRSFG